MSPATPRATIFLITYNQERLVRDAVRSVLEQDYPNLQIILSDDCSKDATFRILCEEAAAYQGPHDVMVRQPPRNLGLVQHFFDVAALSEGELLVCAEGDDIAYPHRVRTLIEAWRDTGADALFSNWDVIDDHGAVIQKGRSWSSFGLRTDDYFRGSGTLLLTGATSAYSAETLQRVPCPTEFVFSEDLYVSLLLKWRGRKIHYVEEPLVAYRRHSESLTHTDRSDQPLAETERFVARWSAYKAKELRLIARMIEEGGTSLSDWGKPATVDRQALQDDIDFNEVRSKWFDLPLVERLNAFLRLDHHSYRRWMLPRLLGIGTLAQAKKVVHMFKRAV